MVQINEATKNEKTTAERKRIPMSVPVLRLEMPEIPGYHQHWFRGTPERIARAQNAGYEFVDARDVKLNNISLGGDSAISGNTDMGSRVSVVSGQEIGRDGQPTRLVLMKIKLELYKEDQALVDESAAHIAASLCGGGVGAEKEFGSDAHHRYVDKTRTQIPDMFKPKRR